VSLMIHTTYMIHTGPNPIATPQFQRLRHGEPSS
jgi:hypothetical protein